MPSPRFLAGLALGVIIGGASVLTTMKESTLTASLFCGSSSSIGAPRCAADLKTTGWKTYQHASPGWEVQYPASYILEENSQSVSLHSELDTRAKIVFERASGSLWQNTEPSMQQASWKIADRGALVLATSYLTEDPSILTATYLFVRDFPNEGADGPYVMMKAHLTIPRGDTAFRMAKQQGITDLESLLTEPEQILSTFRFLRFEEITD